MTITQLTVQDRRFDLPDGAGSDAIHQNIRYAYAVCVLHTDTPLKGTGLAFTLGAGNELVCRAIEALGQGLAGREIEGMMGEFGRVYRSITDQPAYRWLGPHKGVVHLALAAITNACFDLWAKSRQVPLWKLLTELSPEQIVNTLDLSYLEEELTASEAVALLTRESQAKAVREKALQGKYRGYDTSVGWFNYSDEKVVENTRKAMDKGFTAMKLKVGSAQAERDIRRANLIRQTAGDAATLMLDANQQWNYPQAVAICRQLTEINPFWIEEPTHPDDVMAHQKLARAVAPYKIAAGEHIPNKVIFKNFLAAEALSFCQVDALRVGGVSEFITISLLARKHNVPVVPHVGDMGQLHQHLVVFNHMALGHEHLFLEHIPHLQKYFQTPVTIKDGFYQIPQVAGSTCDLVA